MKFKTIFWLFNAIILLVLVLFTLTSFVLFGQDYAASYWGNMWLVTALFVVLIGILDFYFVRNWRLFDLMEKEDWPALLAWLEGRIYGKGQLKRHYANLLINTALSVSNFDAVKKLETEVRQRKPEMLRSLGVSLGIPLILEQNLQSIFEYFDPLANDERTLRRDWARWCRAFAAEDARNGELITLLDTKDPAVCLLSLELLEQRSGDLGDAEIEAVNAAKARLCSALSGEKGKRLLQRSREDHLMSVILSSRIDAARDSLVAASAGSVS